MKRIIYAVILFVFTFFTAKAGFGQTWGNNDERLVPISNNLVNGLISASPPTTTIVEGDILFYTDYYGFNIYNVSDPTNPTKISSLPLPGRAVDFKIEGSFAYVCNETGVEFVNISDLENPVLEEIVFIGFRPYQIIVDGSTIYLASADGVYAFSHNSVHEMTLLDQIYIEPAATEFAGFIKNGHFLYYTNQRKIHALDISNPQNIFTVFTMEYNGGGSSWGSLAISGNYLYAPTTLVMHIFDISNPATPGLVYSGLPTSHTIYEVLVEENTMVLNHNSNGKFTVLDVADPSNPIVRYAHNESWFNHLYRFGALQDGIVYVMDNEQEGYNGYTIHLLDITNNAQPIQAGQILSMPGFTKSVSLLKKNNQTYALVGQSNSGQDRESGLFRILNTTHADEAYLESVIEIESNMTSVGTLNDNWAVVSSGSYSMPVYNLHLSLVNIENPSSPYIADVVPYGSNHTAFNHNNLSTFGGLGFVVSKTHLNIFKENEGSIAMAGSVSIFGQNGIGVYANNSDYVYVAGGNYGFQLYNVSNPSSPYMINYHQINGTCWDVYVDNGIAYVAAYDGGLATFDVSQNIIVPLGQVGAYGQATSVVVLDKLAYVGLMDGRIVLFDITNPAQPQLRGWYLTNGTRVNDLVMDLDPGKSHLYVSNELELLILQMDYFVGNKEITGSDSEVKLYPNPAKEKTVFDLYLSQGTDVEINIYNLAGQLTGSVMRSKLISGNFQIEYNTNELNPGMYLVEIKIGEKKYSEKLIVTK